MRHRSFGSSRQSPRTTNVTLISRMFPLALLILVATSVGGCGSGTGSSTSRATGAIRITVKWPPVTRLIPEAAKSIKVSVKLQGTSERSNVVQRPASGQGTTTVTFQNLIEGDTTLIADAYPMEDGSGISQAHGSTIVRVVSGTMTQTSLTMDSTIVSVSLTPAAPIVVVGQTMPISASAIDSTDAVVLTADSKWTWSSDNTAVASVVGTGARATVAGVTGGTANITATETESGKQAIVIVTVTTSGGGGGGLANSAWPKFRGNAQNTGQGGGSGATGIKKWESFISSATGVVEAVIGPDGTIYFVTGFDNFLYAVDGNNGNQKWRIAVGGAPLEPIVGADGTVYVCSDKVYAINGITGQIVWTFKSDLNGFGLRFDRPAIGSDGTIYVGSADYNFYAIDHVTGKRKWSFASPGGEAYDCPAIGKDGTVYFATAGGNLFALDALTGTKRWSIPIQLRESFFASPIITNDGTLLIASDTSITAYDSSSGQVKWTVNPAGQTLGCPAVSPSGVVYLPKDGFLIALDLNSGAQKWVSPSERRYASPSVGSDGTVYLGRTAYDGVTGQVKWTFTGIGNNANVSGSATVAGDGTILFTTTNEVSGSNTGSKLWAIR